MPEHARFAKARRAWNLTIDQEPAAVVFPESAQDVTNTVLFAAERGQRIATQGTGHGAAPLGSLDDTILVKTERMRGLTIDPVERVARAEAGVLSLEVVQAAARHGLAPLTGSSKDVGVVGYTLGGGLSFLGRKYGLAANHVRAIEIVTADGSLVRADRDHAPDLFWALRGGGGSFGVVTPIEFELFPISQAYAGILWYPIERAPEVLRGWMGLTRSDPPDELTTIGRFLNLPPIPEIPEPVRGKSFVVGDGMTLAELQPGAIDALVDAAGADAAFPLLSVEVRHLGGELNRDRPANGALSSIEAKYLLYAAGMAPTPELQRVVGDQVTTVKRAMTPWAAGQMYLNFADTRRPPDTLWSAPALERLRAVKATVDPGNLFRANHNIPPAE